MAATRLITMHQNKGKSVAKSLSDRTDIMPRMVKRRNMVNISVPTHARLRQLMKNLCSQKENMSV